MKNLSLFLIASFVFACTNKPSQNTSTSENTEVSKIESHFVKASDGTKIHYLTLGGGSPVLLIHGYYASAKLNWFDNGIAQALAKKYRVIAMDNRGHGQSDKPHNKEAYGDKMWRDAIAVLDDQKIKQAHIHGYSMGGSMLTQILFHHPERVLSATYGGSGIPEVNKQRLRDTKADAAIPKLLRMKEGMLRAKIAGFNSNDHKALKIVGNNAPWSGPEPKKIDLSKINIPVLAILGEFDSPNKRTARMQREIKNFKRVILPGKGHLTAIVEGYMPPEYLKESLNFLDKI